MTITSVILAAGKGTRMNSDLPKVLHPILEKPMILYAVETARAVTGQKPILVIGHQAERVREAVGDRAHYVYQHEQKGTAHAVQQAEGLLRDRTDTVLITSGDMPLFKPETLAQLIAAPKSDGTPMSMLTVIADNPRGFGRIVRGPDGRVTEIVEEAVATPEQLAIRELNVGAYAVSNKWVWDALKKITPAPKGEYYLTDLVAVAVQESRRVEAIVVEDVQETIGINTPEHLAEAERLLQTRHAG